MPLPHSMTLEAADKYGIGARLILAASISQFLQMTFHSKIWAIGALALFVPLGVYVMVGGIPGAYSDVQALQDLATITSSWVGKHGAFLTGLFYMLVGSALAAVFLVWGDDLRRSEGDGSGAVGDCGDGGD